MTQDRTVSLPEDLCAQAEKRLGSRFVNLDDLLSFILRELTKDDASKYDEAEKQIIEQRLRDLGYM